MWYFCQYTIGTTYVTALIGRSQKQDLAAQMSEGDAGMPYLNPNSLGNLSEKGAMNCTSQIVGKAFFSLT